MTLLERFRARALATPSAPLFRFLDDAGREVDAMTVGETWQQCSALAGHLRRSCELAPGDRALLVYPPSLDFVRSLVGCLLAGVVPVPLPPPDPLRLTAELERFGALARSSGARVVLTNTKYAAARTLGTVRHALSRPWRRWPDLPWHTTDRARSRSTETLALARAPGDVAFLQYTSGSTSQPKGVVITYGNLAHQHEASARELGFDADSIMVSWMPHFHDFGLISGILSALHGNGQYVSMSPLTFVQKPQRWFEAISRLRATHTAAPTFGYDLALRKTTERERAEWDLSALRIAMCAAEPIHPDLARRFAEGFAVSKLRPTAFCPAYGLAEHSVGVSTRGRGVLRVDRDTLEREGRLAPPVEGNDVRSFVGCGEPSEGVRLRVVDPETGAALSEGRVGELWVDSPSKAAGYYGLPEETERTFRARLAGDDTEYLRTGDLGLVHRGQVYITGRLKDVLIVRGRNLHPQDLEETARHAHAHVRPGGLAAFSELDQGEEKLILVVEVRDEARGAEALREVARACAAKVLEEHQQALRAVVLVRAGAVPKTTSGKVMRGACKQAWARGELARGALHVERSGGTSATTAPSGDPRRRDLDADFAALIEGVGRGFQRMTEARRGRVFHKEATTLRGTLKVLDSPDLPPHRFFAPGARYGVLVRHANGVQEDDAAGDNRGATVRVLPLGSDDYDATLLDLLLTTGTCFLARSARDFERWTRNTPAGREALVRAEPHRGAAAWDMFRRPSSYTRLHYHSKIASRFSDARGGRWLARFRLVPGDGGEDTGFLDAGGVLLPPELMPRLADDTRSRTFLHDELRARLVEGPLRYRLQIQLRPAGGDDEQSALDCTLPWSETWRDTATLELDARADEGRVEGLAFNPFHAPPELALPLARSADDTASLGHLRSLVYELTAQTRRAAKDRPTEKPPRQRVCVVGGGAAGLATAWALEREGYAVTLLERGPEVAGKCASLELDGHVYDWGGHLCTAHYRALARMTDALGVEKDPATPTLVYDLEAGSVRPREDNARLREEYLRYQGLRAAQFPGLLEPGLHRVATTLAQPVEAWLRANDLKQLGEALGINYTACGYGFLQDETLAALYVLKAAELGGILSTGRSSGLPEAWTPRGGFGAFWRRVAGSLADVRCNAAPRAIERTADGVVVHLGSERLTFDRLVVASPLDEALGFLDASPEERALFSRVRYLDYHTLVVRAQGLPRGGFYLLRDHCRDARRLGHPVAFHHRYDDSDVYLFYAYGAPGLGRDALESRLREDVARLGGRVEAVVAHRPWRYFPHAASADVADGYYGRLEALQGQRRTYYVGSLFNFELVEANVAYAHDLVARHFSRAEAAPTAHATEASGTPLAATLSRATNHDERVAVLTEYLQRLLAESLELPERPPPSDRFLDLGLDSVGAVEVFQRLATDTGAHTLAPVLFFDHPTIEALARYLATELADAPSSTPRRASGAREPHRALAGRGRVVRTDCYEQLEDLVISDEHGLALTMDVFAPTNGSNGLAVVDVVSALWSSTRDVIVNHKVYGTYDAFCRQGFTVFAVRPGSSTRFTGADMVENVRRAVRHVRLHAHEHGVDAERLGLLGGSSGGMLACLAALTATPDSRVQAVVAHCPITRYARAEFAPEHAALFHGLVAPGGLTGGLSEDEFDARCRAISPLDQVHGNAPATLVLHARHDTVVPFAASEEFVAALQRAGASAELGARESDRHPWPGIEKDMILSARWMEDTLRAARPSGPVDAWLRTVRSVDEPALRLVCLHHAGGTSALFDAWPDGLPAQVEVIAVELPGRGSRADEAPCTELGPLLDALERALASLHDRPFALFGHSFGAVVAFELCRRLRRQGAPMPSHLFVSGFVGPRAYDPATALRASDLGPAFDLGGAALRSDFALFHSWRYEPEAPLDVPITAFVGASDSFTARDGFGAWRDETASAFESAELPGHHLYLATDPFPLLARLTHALAPNVLGEARVAAFAARWRARPHALAGSWNHFDLCWLARVADERGDAPAFPEALAALLPLQREDGGLGQPSPHPYCNLVTSLAFANTLLRWNTDGRHTAALDRVLTYALNEHARSPHASDPNDRHFRFHGFFGRWLVPARECEQLLQHGDAHLAPEARHMARAYASARDVAFDHAGGHHADHARLFDEDSLALHFGEYLPAPAFTSDAARDHARRTAGLPGLTAATAARYYEVTRDPTAHTRLSAALDRPHDGLRPGGRLQELHFALAYLLRGGIDLSRGFEAELAELEASLGPHGVGVEPGARVVDGDATAVTQRVCHALGLATPYPTRQLEAFWNTERGSYQSADGHATYTVSTTLHVLEAWLHAPDVTPEEQRAVWSRTVALLAERPWVELHHLSPFYVWEKIVSIVGAHAHRFPDAPTRAHRDALARILAQQADDGGFASAYTEASNREETALALLALRSALAWCDEPEERARVAKATGRARAFLLRAIGGPGRPDPSLWVGKLLYTPANLVDAIVTASLGP